jgi:hypothetical protein
MIAIDRGEGGLLPPPEIPDSGIAAKNRQRSIKHPPAEFLIYLIYLKSQKSLSLTPLHASKTL